VDISIPFDDLCRSDPRCWTKPSTGEAGPGRYRIETFESPYATVVVLDTHTGEVRFTGIGGAGGGKQIGSVEMCAELAK